MESYDIEGKGKMVTHSFQVFAYSPSSARSQEMAHESGDGVEGEDGAELTIYKVAGQAL